VILTLLTGRDWHANRGRRPGRRRRGRLQPLLEEDVEERLLRGPVVDEGLAEGLSSDVGGGYAKLRAGRRAGLTRRHRASAVQRVIFQVC
jgi:hypothetical protein